MRRFDVPDMSCGHCTASIEKAIKATDPAANITCSTATRTVDIDSDLSTNALIDTIRGAGYEAQAAASA